ncbi:uncharacterized protein LOC144630259 [Oculina patagonica]
MSISNFLFLTVVLLLSFHTVLGEEYFKCYECESRVSSDDCDEHKVARNCTDNVVFMDGEEWWPTYDRCLKIVDETKDPPWYYRRCGFYDLWLHYIKVRCHKPFCEIESCSQPLCLIGTDKTEEEEEKKEEGEEAFILPG